MINKHYACDGGSIMIGNETCRACFPNHYGDGYHNVYLCRDEEYPTWGDEWDFMGTVEGTNLNVYDYDCYHGDALTCDSNFLFVLSGRYAVYAHDGDIIIQKWD